MKYSFIRAKRVGGITMIKKTSEKKRFDNLMIASQTQQPKDLKSIKTPKMNRSTQFYIGYVFAILAWFSYASLTGLDMMTWTKSNHWQAKGAQYQSGKSYSHK
jgi:hypothetical protein